MSSTRPHTTIRLKKATKSRLDKNRPPGQYYDGFLCQMMDLWESSNGPGDARFLRFAEREPKLDR